jgi:hypothetical protein
MDIVVHGLWFSDSGMVFFGYLKFDSIFIFLSIQIILVILLCRLNVFKRVYYNAFFFSGITSSVIKRFLKFYYPSISSA